MEEFSGYELNSLRFYQGDIGHYDLAVDKEKYKSWFYTTKEAYHILNLLLHPGTESEVARICLEGKNIPIELLRNLEEIIQIYDDIFTVMCKYRKDNIQEEIHIYRKDRMQSMDMVNSGNTFAFTSCALKDDIDGYFKKKSGILLLELMVPQTIPYVALNDFLKDSRFQSQQEVLLPPFMKFHAVPMSFTEREMKYRDINDELPKAKFMLEAVEMEFETEEDMFDGSAEKIAADKIFGAEEIEFAIEFLKELQTTGCMSDEGKRRYCEWKAAIQRVVREHFKEIYSKYS